MTKRVSEPQQNTKFENCYNILSIVRVGEKIFTLIPQYDVVFNTGKSLPIKQNFTFLKEEIELFSDDYYLKLTGNFLELIFNFNVENRGQIVGHIEKAWFAWGDTYEITVYDAAFEAELLALLIAVDDIKDSEGGFASASAD